MALKHTHVMFAVLSIILFYTRAISRLASGKLAANKGVFIASHSVDTVLLISAVSLAVMASLNPAQQPWLMEKIVLVIAYIALGFVIAKSTTKAKQIGALVMATGTLLAVGYLASAKNALIL